jgi:hypothetical protein
VTLSPCLQYPSAATGRPARRIRPIAALLLLLLLPLLHLLMRVWVWMVRQQLGQLQGPASSSSRESRRVIQQQQQ